MDGVARQPEPRGTARPPPAWGQRRDRLSGHPFEPSAAALLRLQPSRRAAAVARSHGTHLRLMPTTVEVRSIPVLSGLDEATVPPGDWEELTACGACGEDGALRDVVTVAGRRQAATVLAVCDRCEHAFLRRRPTQAWFDRYYAAEWDARGRSADAAETPLGRKVAGFCAPHLGERARVLDVGAGFGSQLLGFRELGHEPYGLERSEHRAAHVES